MRRTSLSLPVAAAVAASLLSVAAGPAPEACDELPELGPRACATADAGRVLLGDTCDEPGVVPHEACGQVRGITVDEALVDAYASSTLSALHALQRDLGTALPLARAQVISSHNSYNSGAYLPSVAASDPNQHYSLTDQLRMDVREIELDVHTWVGIDGDATLPVLCHATGPHIGCSADRPLLDGLRELRTWLDDNPDEVLLIDVEDHLDGAAGHDEAAAIVDDVLGDVLYRPPSDAPCADLPLEVSFDDVRTSGAQVLIVSSCGSGSAWGGLVHAYGDWHQGRLGAFDGATCGSDYGRETYDAAVTRYWEDTTWLSTMAGGPGPRLEGDTLRDAMACGLSLASLDRIHPEDPRLETLLWSWATDASPMTATEGAVAVLGLDGRMHLRDPEPDGAVRASAALCEHPDGSFEVRSWEAAHAVHVAPSTAEAWSSDWLCGSGFHSVPRSARELQQVRAAIERHGARVGPVTSDILLAYVVTDVDADGPVWTAR